MAKDSADNPPRAEEQVGLGFSHRQILVTMSGLVVAMLLAMLDNMIVAPALPTIVGELGGLNHLAWVTTGYVLASTVATPIWGKLGDLYGRRIIFTAAVAIFLIGSALCGVSQDMAQLVAFRAIQGLGAGGLMVGVLSIIGEMIPPRDRSKYQGVMMAVMPVAMIGGPLIGGFITDNLSWRWAFYVNLPLGAVTLILCWITLAKLPKGTGKAVIDWWGTGLLTIWITALVLVTSWGGTQYEWGSAQILGLIAVAVVGFVAFIMVERRVAEPIMPLRVFKSANFSLSGGVSFISGFAMFGAMGFLPQFQQFVQGSSATNSGLLLMPMMIAAMVVSLSAGQLISKTGHYKSLPVIGSILVTVGLALFATMDVDTSTFVSGIYMVLLGAGMGAMMQTSTLIAQNSLDLRDMGAGTGVSTFLRNMGSSLGVSLLGAVYTSHLADTLTGTPAVAASATRMTPQLLRSLPESVQKLFEQAVTNGVTALFTWGAVVAAVGIVVALFIRQVPLRSAVKPQAASTDAEPVAVSS
ncbi:MDR family MFS transporter [Nonomuraea sp. NPDC049141]|uniref:MDR family MFS transporter n=1 Tax=unclassified Nonomuraea TaxID=2593643 RepID=UPI0033DAA9C6